MWNALSSRVLLPACVAICVAAFGCPALGQAPAAQAEAAATAAAPEPLGEDELEALVARIALYPDELVALISAASLYPLQIVEAQRFLEQRKKNAKLEPKSTWDGSVVSLLNYPEIVKMMSDDLDWTQSLGEALANQQKDVLVAIQQLRDQALASNIIKSDDKIKVVHENDNIIIQPANPEKIYIPQYPPEMLYVENYAPAPISYYPETYEPYYWPGATFFAGAVTGAIFASAVDWNNWGVWGGRWNGNIDVDCNNCFNNRNFNGKIDMKDVDWRNVDRSKINIDRNQLNNFNRTNIQNNLQANNRNNIKNRASEINRNNAARPGGSAGNVKDIRKSTLDGLKGQGQGRPGQGAAAGQRPGQGAGAGAGQRPRPETRPAGGNNRPGQGASRPAGKKKPGGKVDNRPRNPSGLGQVGPGRNTKMQSNRGARSMGGGMGGGPPRAMNYGGGRPQSMHRGGGGGPRMPRGGGGRGGGGGRRR
jgi:hypothetical protein